MNSLGSQGTRARYREALRAYLEPKKANLSEHAQKRLDDNPLRILDSKNPKDREAIAGAPSILDLLEPDDRAHWEGLKRALTRSGRRSSSHPDLVRGLDYYTRTLFEIRSTAGELGTQNALLGGGRYDGMVEELGGPEDCRRSASPWASNACCLPCRNARPEAPPRCFIAPLGERAALEALVLARELRKAGIAALADTRGGSLKSMLRRADSLGARLCLVLGDAELERGVVAVKDLASRRRRATCRARSSSPACSTCSGGPQGARRSRHDRTSFSSLRRARRGRHLLCDARRRAGPNGPGAHAAASGRARADHRPAAPKPKKDPDEPELHAAPGASDQVVAPGSEPSLPDNPLAHQSRARSSASAATSDPDWEDHGRDLKTTHEFYGPYYEEHSDRYSFRLAFPVWAERKQPSLGDASVTDRASLYGGLYYNRRSADRSDDILFPLFWNMVDKRKKARTTIIGPIVNRVTPDERDNWLAPLFFSGKRKTRRLHRDPAAAHLLADDGRGGLQHRRPDVLFLQGRQHCDTRTAEDIDFGIAPLYFFGQNAEVQVRDDPAAPPLLSLQRSRSFVAQRVGSVLARAHAEARHVPPLAALLEHLGQERAPHHGAPVLSLRL